MPEISVVIPCYNRAHCIAQTLESVFAQTFTEYEILIIDDGSTDGTREVVASFGDRVRSVHQENRGLAGARNRGVEEARGEWIAFLDSDDLWLPTKLEVQMAAMRQEPDLAVHVTNATIFREHLGEEKNLYQLTGFAVDPHGFTRLEHPLIPCVSQGLAWMQCALVRRKTLQRVGDFRRDLQIYMDFEMGARLARQGPWIAHHEPLVRILRQDQGEVESISSRSGTIEGHRELVAVYALMLGLPGLSGSEQRFLRRKLSDAQGRLGVALRKCGNFREARRQVFQGFLTCARPGSLVKLLANSLPPVVLR